MVDFLRELHERTEVPLKELLDWAEIPKGKFYDWVKRHGQENRHNADAPRSHYLLEEEKEAILAFQSNHPLVGYRALSYMMIDAGVAAVSPASVHRVLAAAGVIDAAATKTGGGRKGQGFVQPKRPHQHWHIDVAYLNLGGTFYYLCLVLDGYSRKILSWGIDESMTEADIEVVIERAREAYPKKRPRIISDNGPQFTAVAFKSYVRQCGMTHVRTSPYYPQSNGKLERLNRTVKQSLRPKRLNTLTDANKAVTDIVEHYNHHRLHHALGYVTPQVMLEGRQKEVFKERKKRILEARNQRMTTRREKKTMGDKFKTAA